MEFSDILLTVDYDRTMTAPDSTIPERNLEAIRYFMENGGTFTINTGRSVNTMGKLFDKIPVNAPFLLYNGSAIYENGVLTQVHAIDLELWQTMEQVHSQFPDLNLEIQGAKTHYLYETKPEFKAFYDAVGWQYALAVPGSDIGPFIKFSLFGDIHQNDINHLFYGDTSELARMDEAEQWILQQYGDKVDTHRAAPRILDVHAKGISKLSSARALQASLGKKVLVCVGDAQNDISMLDGADYAFCPADGVVAANYPNVCQCADGAVADVIYNRLPLL